MRISGVIRTALSYIPTYLGIWLGWSIYHDKMEYSAALLYIPLAVVQLITWGLNASYTEAVSKETREPLRNLIMEGLVLVWVTRIDGRYKFDIRRCPSWLKNKIKFYTDSEHYTCLGYSDTLDRSKDVRIRKEMLTEANLKELDLL